MIKSTKSIMIIYMLSGVATMMTLRAINERKPGFGSTGHTVVGAVAVLLVLWNVWMYRKAKLAGTGENAASAIERYTSPVAATITFVIGMILFAF